MDVEDDQFVADYSSTRKEGILCFFCKYSEVFPENPVFSYRQWIQIHKLHSKVQIGEIESTHKSIIQQLSPRDCQSCWKLPLPHCVECLEGGVRVAKADSPNYDRYHHTIWGATPSPFRTIFASWLRGTETLLSFLLPLISALFFSVLLGKSHSFRADSLIFSPLPIFDLDPFR